MLKIIVLLENQKKIFNNSVNKSILIKNKIILITIQHHKLNYLNIK